MKQLIDHKRMLYILFEAQDHGLERKSLTSFYWNASQRCSNPYTVNLQSRPRAEGVKFNDVHLSHAYNPGKAHTIFLDVDTPCRKCENCLSYRAHRWRKRAEAELKAASRTWFCTFTLTPQEHQLCYLRACSKLASQNIDFDTLSDNEKVKHLANQVNPYLTLFFKRVRKNSKAKLRYLLVTEAHKSGKPHFHALIHEASLPVTKRVLEKAWPHGFTNFKLVSPADKRAAIYVTKYLSKSLLARVRASKGYGKETNEVSFSEFTKEFRTTNLLESELANVYHDPSQ